jgi:hypothetical protein
MTYNNIGKNIKKPPKLPGIYNYSAKIPFKTISATKNTTSLSLCLRNISHSCSTSKMMSAGVGAGARNRFPFTATQWQELEHQALIFKYIISSFLVVKHQVSVGE